MTRFLPLLVVLIVISLANACAPDVEYAGRYVRGPEQNNFVPCGSSQEFWVNATDEVFASFVEFYETETQEPYQEVYVRFRGHLLDDATEGFAMFTDGLIRVSEVTGYSVSVPDTCELHAVWAQVPSCFEEGFDRTVLTASETELAAFEALESAQSRDAVLSVLGPPSFNCGSGFFYDVYLLKDGSTVWMTFHFGLSRVFIEDPAGEKTRILVGN